MTMVALKSGSRDLSYVTCRSHVNTRRSHDLPAELRIPLQSVDVHEHGATGNGYIRYMNQ